MRFTHSLGKVSYLFENRLCKSFDKYHVWSRSHLVQKLVYPGSQTDGVTARLLQLFRTLLLATHLDLDKQKTQIV